MKKEKERPLREKEGEGAPAPHPRYLCVYSPTQSLHRNFAVFFSQSSPFLHPPATPPAPLQKANATWLSVWKASVCPRTGIGGGVRVQPPGARNISLRGWGEPGRGWGSDRERGSERRRGCWAFFISSSCLFVHARGKMSWRRASETKDADDFRSLRKIRGRRWETRPVTFKIKPISLWPVEIFLLVIMYHFTTSSLDAYF